MLDALWRDCERLEDALNSRIYAFGVCEYGAHLHTRTCAGILGASLLGALHQPPDLKPWSSLEFARNTAAFDIRSYTNGGSCGFLEIEISSRSVQAIAEGRWLISYDARAGQGVAGSARLTVEHREDVPAVTALDLGDLPERVEQDEQARSATEAQAIVARLRKAPTLGDLDLLREYERHHAELADELQAAKARLRAVLEAQPPPLAVSDGRADADLLSRDAVLSVAIRNTADKPIARAVVGVWLTPEGESEPLGEGRICQKVTRTLPYQGLLPPGASTRLIDDPLYARALLDAPHSFSRGTGTQKVRLRGEPLSVHFTTGETWISPRLVDEIPSECGLY